MATPWARPSARTESETDIHAKAAAYGIDSEVSTAWTWSPSRPPPAAPCQHPRDRRPYFLECRTYRFRAHSMFDAQLYRDKEEIANGATRGRSSASRDGC
jgi:2-oxoisovalerate dehydrogenase E1 component